MFSIIIPTCNRVRDLTLMLSQLAPNLAQLQVQTEVIVTSDSRDDATKQLVTELGYKFVLGPQRGPAANRNFGASHAKYDWLVFLDDDCVPQADFLQAYLTCITAHPTVKVVEGAIIPAGDVTPWNAEIIVNTTGGHLWSCNFAIRRDYFNKLRGFDERFLKAASEDVDLCYRIQRDSVPILFASTAAVVHPVRYPSLLDLWRKQLLTRWRIFADLKHNPRSFFSACLSQVVQQPINILRRVRQCINNRNQANIRSQVFNTVFSLIILPIILPYTIYWEFKFRQYV